MLVAIFINHRGVLMNRYKKYAEVEQLPPIPSTIKPLPHSEAEQSQVNAVVIAGLNLLGERGYMCPTVSIINLNHKTGEMFGWSLCLGNPDPKLEEKPYYFRISEKEGASTVRGTEIPNAIIYLEAEVDEALTEPEADSQKLEEVLAYVLPYISDNGPPSATGKSFKDLAKEMPTSSSERKEAHTLKKQINYVLNLAAKELTEHQDYWELLDELNQRLNDSGLSYAWNSNSSDPDLNPDIGVIKKTIAGRSVNVSIGLGKDGFVTPCAVIYIVDT